MTEQQLKFVFYKFRHEAAFESFKELASGHINDTYLIITKEKPFYVLQKINHSVFKDVPGLIRNKVAVSHHLKEKIENLPKKTSRQRVLSFVPTGKEKFYYEDINGNYWNLTVYFENCITYETVTNERIAFEGGKLIGEFLNLTTDFDSALLVEVIPGFHDMSYRYGEFNSALKIANKERLLEAKELIDRVIKLKKEMHTLQGLKESGSIRERLTHNDTKISNILFSKEGQGLCVIDTDTVMPGIVHYDFGDAIRTICNTAAEDETNLDLVAFNVAYYKAYKKGFLEGVNNALTPLELKYLPLGVKTMIFIMALRFLTDYLNGDIYYKTKYPNHNLDRSKNQFKLISSFTEQQAFLDYNIIN